MITAILIFVPSWSVASDYWSQIESDASVAAAENLAAEMYLDVAVDYADPQLYRIPDTKLAALDFQIRQLSKGPTDRSFNPVISSSVLTPREKSMMAFIARYEAGRSDLNSVWYGNKVPLPGPVVSMTVCEVMRWQKVASRKQKSTAIGRFQVTSATMREVVDALGLDCNRLYDEKTQNEIGRFLLHARGWQEFLNGVLTPVEFGQNLAGEWAAFPATQGAGKGRSRYEGIAGNKHGVELGEYLSFLERLVSLGSKTG